MRQIHKTIHSNGSHPILTTRRHHHKAELESHANHVAPVLIPQVIGHKARGRSKGCEGHCSKITLLPHSIDKQWGAEDLSRVESKGLRQRELDSIKFACARSEIRAKTRCHGPRRKARMGVSGHIRDLRHTEVGAKSQDASGEGDEERVIDGRGASGSNQGRRVRVRRRILMKPSGRTSFHGLSQIF